MLAVSFLRDYAKMSYNSFFFKQKGIIKTKQPCPPSTKSDRKKLKKRRMNYIKSNNKEE